MAQETSHWRELTIQSLPSMLGRTSPVPRRLKVRPHIGAALTTLADKPRLDIRQSHVIRPLLGRHLNRVAAAIVGAIDQDADRPGSAHPVR